MSMDRIEAALTTLKSLLLKDETVIQSSHQLRLKALKHRREIVVATNMRLVIFIRRLIGGYRMHDIRWQDLQDAAINENLLPGLFGAELRLRLYTGNLVRIDGLEPVSARALYVYCQQQEQEWREKNRVRGMEERSGLGFVGMPGMPGTAGSTGIPSAPGIPGPPMPGTPAFDALFSAAFSGATPGTVSHTTIGSPRTTSSSTVESTVDEGDSFTLQGKGDFGALAGMAKLMNPATAAASADKLAKGMAEAKKQFDAGKLSAAEYESAKAKVLSSL